MNGPHTPMFLRDNKWTRVIERAAAANAEAGKPAGRMMEQLTATGSRVIPAARLKGMTEAEQARVAYVPPPEDPRAAMMANSRAAALGIADGSVPGMGGGGAVEVGDLSDAEIDAMLAGHRGQDIPGATAAGEGAAAPAPIAASIRPQDEAKAAQRAVALPAGRMGAARTMPDFSRVEGFDLIRKVAVVDGMEFRLADDDVVAMKKYAIQVVLDNVTFQLAQALIALGIPQEMAAVAAETMRKSATDGATPGGMLGTGGAAGAGASTEAVSKVQENQGTESVLPGPEVAGRIDGPMPGVRDEVQPLAAKAPGGPEVSDHDAGGGTSPPAVGSGDGATDDVGYLLGDGGPPSP